MYVGGALDLQSRLLEHLSENEKSAGLKKQIQSRKCGFEFGLVDHPKYVKGIEKYLYDLYRRPKFNEKDPGGETPSGSICPS